MTMVTATTNRQPPNTKYHHHQHSPAPHSSHSYTLPPSSSLTPDDIFKHMISSISSQAKGHGLHETSRFSPVALHVPDLTSVAVLRMSCDAWRTYGTWMEMITHTSHIGACTEHRHRRVKHLIKKRSRLSVYRRGHDLAIRCVMMSYKSRNLPKNEQ